MPTAMSAALMVAAAVVVVCKISRCRRWKCC